MTEDGTFMCKFCFSNMRRKRENSKRSGGVKGNIKRTTPLSGWRGLIRIGKRGRAALNTSGAVGAFICQNL